MKKLSLWFICGCDGAVHLSFAQHVLSLSDTSHSFCDGSMLSVLQAELKKKQPNDKQIKKTDVVGLLEVLDVGGSAHCVWIKLSYFTEVHMITCQKDGGVGSASVTITYSKPQNFLLSLFHLDQM